MLMRGFLGAGERGGEQEDGELHTASWVEG